MVWSGGKKQDLPPVRLPLKVAWVVSGAVRTLFLCAFGLRRNVLDVPGHAEFHVFGSVSHEGTDMELQGLPEELRPEAWRVLLGGILIQRPIVFYSISKV